MTDLLSYWRHSKTLRWINIYLNYSSTVPILFSVAWDLQLVDLFIIPRIVLYPVWMVLHMDEGTIKTPIPKCRLYWSFLFGVGKQFCRLWIWSETEWKTPAEYGLQHNSTLPPPPSPQPHTVCIYVHLVWEGGRGGGQRQGRGATVHKYSSFVLGANNSQAGSTIPTMSECISSLYNLLHTMPSVNRSILKKSRQ